MITLPSQLLEQAVEELSKMPGIGKRTALRLALWMLKQDEQHIAILGTSLIRLRNEIQYCSKCYNISDTPFCSICSDPRRDQTLVIVVKDIRDVMAIEQTGQYRGLYHVLGGVISPLDGVSPDDLTIKPLLNRIADDEINELILAMNPDIEGDTTAFYIYRKLEKSNLTVSTIARGVPVGDDLEYADEVTLGRSILNRVPYSNSNK